MGFFFMVASRMISLTVFYINSFRKDKRILYISDSRGFLVGSVVSYKNHFKNELISGLNRNYAVLPIINRKKHTTLLDGLDFLLNSHHKYDLVVFHLGVVDFSPRSKSSAELIRRAKMSSFERKSRNRLALSQKQVLHSFFSPKREIAIYEGEYTDSIANEVYVAAVKDLIKNISNPIIAITTNVVDLSWRGNYWRERPANINNYLAFERQFWQDIGVPCISLDDCAQSVRETTLDNIHPTNLGFQKLEQLVREEIEKIY